MREIMNFVPSIALKGIDSLIESFDEDPERLMLEVGFLPELLERPDSLVEGQQFNDLIEHSAHQLGQRFFGLQLAAIQGASILGPLLFLLQNSATVEEGIQTLLDNYASHTEITYFERDVNPNGSILTYRVSHTIKGECTQIIELGLAILCLNLRRYLGSEWRAKAVYFEHAKPYETGLLVEMFGDNIFFNQDVSGILLTDDEMSRPIRDASRLSQRHYEQEITKRMEFSPRSAVVQTVNIINASLTRHPCSLDFVAKSLGKSPRTLRHYLQQQGTCFNELLREARLNLALRYLSHSGLSITEISARLQFSETSVFSRFVKKNTGLTPRQHRNNDDHSVAITAKTT